MYFVVSDNELDKEGESNDQNNQVKVIKPKKSEEMHLEERKSRSRKVRNKSNKDTESDESQNLKSNDISPRNQRVKPKESNTSRKNNKIENLTKQCHNSSKVPNESEKADEVSEVKTVRTLSKIEFRRPDEEKDTSIIEKDTEKIQNLSAGVDRLVNGSDESESDNFLHRSELSGMLSESDSQMSTALFTQVEFNNKIENWSALQKDPFGFNDTQPQTFDKQTSERISVSGTSDTSISVDKDLIISDKKKEQALKKDKNVDEIQDKTVTTNARKQNKKANATIGKDNSNTTGEKRSENDSTEKKNPVTALKTCPNQIENSDEIIDESQVVIPGTREPSPAIPESAARRKSRVQYSGVTPLRTLINENLLESTGKWTDCVSKTVPGQKNEKEKAESNSFFTNTGPKFFKSRGLNKSKLQEKSIVNVSIYDFGGDTTKKGKAKKKPAGTLKNNKTKGKKDVCNKDVSMFGDKTFVEEQVC